MHFYIFCELIKLAYFFKKCLSRTIQPHNDALCSCLVMFCCSSVCVYSYSISARCWHWCTHCCSHTTASVSVKQDLGGGHQTNSFCSVVFPIFHHCELLNIMFMFGRFHHSKAVLTSIKKWRWFKETTNRYFCKVINFLNLKISERSCSGPTPDQYG